MNPLPNFLRSLVLTMYVTRSSGDVKLCMRLQYSGDTTRIEWKSINKSVKMIVGRLADRPTASVQYTLKTP